MPVGLMFTFSLDFTLHGGKVDAFPISGSNLAPSRSLMILLTTIPAMRHGIICIHVEEFLLQAQKNHLNLVVR